VSALLKTARRVGDVESAESSARLMANLIADKKRRMMEQQRGG